MSMDKLDSTLQGELSALKDEGRAKARERIITGYVPPKGLLGPRYRLEGSDRTYIRLNSNSYLSLSQHPELIKAADQATQKFGVGPGAVRFIDGTFSHHDRLEKKIAQFLSKPAARIFNSAYTANCGLALSISTGATYWIGDELNHNSIIRAMRIAGVPKSNKAIYAHNDMAALEKCLEEIPDSMERVVVIFDGIFSMRGDHAPVDRIIALCRNHEKNFKDGIITVMDDSHGIGAYGDTGRGTAEFCRAVPDIIIGTFGKAFGVNGGFIAASSTLIEAVRQKADTYIYTNPLSVADCAAAIRALEICDSKEGRELMRKLMSQTRKFRRGLEGLGKETINGPHPVVPYLVKDTHLTHRIVKMLFDNGVLTVGLTFPVVPRGAETIRFQINACHTDADLDYVIELLKNFA